MGAVAALSQSYHISDVVCRSRYRLITRLLVRIYLLYAHYLHARDTGTVHSVNLQLSEARDSVNSAIICSYDCHRVLIVVHYRLGQKSKPPTGLSINRIKTCRQSYFLLKLSVEQVTEVNANMHLLVLNILSIKYSMYDVKCDVNYCVHTL